jgi:hypothetical protein
MVWLPGSSVNGTQAQCSARIVDGGNAEKAQEWEISQSPDGKSYM